MAGKGGAARGRGRGKKKISTDDDGDGEYRPRRKTCPISAASTAGNGENCPRKSSRITAAASTAGDNNGETEDRSTNCDVVEIHVIDDDDSTGDGEDDLIYYYSDDDDDAEPEVDGNATSPAEQRYVVLSQDSIRARQESAIAEVAEVLSVPAGFAAALLRHFQWRAMRVEEEWFADDRRIRDAVGLPSSDGDAAPPTAVSRRRLSCGICFEGFAAGETRAAACAAHFYCDDCWRGYIRAAVDDGPRCLSLRCPEPSCSAAVSQELVDAVTTTTTGGDHGDRGDDVEDVNARYARFALWSFVDDSGGRVKWCPGRRCTNAIEFLSGGCNGGGGEAADVFCGGGGGCRHGFCWRCGEEAHRPVSCATVRAWLAKNVSDSASANWVLTHTKHCPSCRKPIEKNQGCNHMSCRCGHYFCWICLQSLYGPHVGCNGYTYSAGPTAAADGSERWRWEQARASLDRYLYHYERWAAHQTSLQKVFQDMAELDKSGMEKMTADGDLRFLTKAYEQVADCRRVLRWAHAYGYFLDPVRDAVKRNLFDQLQKDANSSLERLHGCAEGERKELVLSCAGDGDDGDVGERFKSYRKKLENLTVVTQRYFENLVKAFETDLAEVKPATPVVI